MTQTVERLRLSPHQLTSKLSAQLFERASIETNQPFIGHERAKDALAFGLVMQAPGFNVYAMGDHGTGRQTLIKQMLAAQAKREETPEEWCYINNFDNSHEPYKLYVSPGDGKQLLARMNTFIDELLDLFPRVFDNPGYQRQKAAVDREFNQRYDEALANVEQIALQNDVVLYEEKGEVGFAPLVDGKPLNDEEFSKLDEAQREKFYELLTKLEGLLAEQLLELPLWKRESSDKLRKLKFDTAEQAIRPLLKELEHEFAANLGVLKYLKTVKAHIVDVVLELLVEESNNENTNTTERIYANLW